MDERQLDDDVANLTDALLENRMDGQSEDYHDLEIVVRQLNSVIEPDVPPSPQFRERLTQRINDEWTMARRTRQPRLYLNRPARIAALAASVTVVLVGVALALNTLGNSGDDPPVGTAVGDGGWPVFALLAVGGVAALVVLCRGRR